MRGYTLIMAKNSNEIGGCEILAVITRIVRTGVDGVKEKDGKKYNKNNGAKDTR